MTDRLFIVGAQRCGTSYLYRLLDQHPGIEMARPLRPEPKFFLDEALFALGLGHYDRTFFAGRPGARVRGEKSTSYLESDVAADRIAAAFPGARILVLVREPVARAVSHWRFSVANGVETLPLAEALEREPERREDYDRARFSVSPFAYLSRGRYAEQIERWARRFPAAHLKVLVTEALVGSAPALAELFDWLEVDPAFVPEGLERPVNASQAAAGPDAPSDALPGALRAELEAAFAEPNRDLAERYGLDLSPWRRATRTGTA